jgi:hypothetical protein
LFTIEMVTLGLFGDGCRAFTTATHNPHKLSAINLRLNKQENLILTGDSIYSVRMHQTG